LSGGFVSLARTAIGLFISAGVLMSRNATEAVNSYVTDMLALEQHIQKAINGQIEDLDEDYPEVVGHLRVVEREVEGHIETLKALAERRVEGGQGLADVVKRAGSAVLGAGAAAVDFVRNEKLPKNLRDDYTATSLAAIGYVMLHTTALSLGDREVADLAHRHLKDHARNVMLLHNLIPGAVIAFLQKDGLPARANALDEVSRNLESVWADQGGSVPEASELGVGTRTAGTGTTGTDRPITDRM
jgi:ferritin-like metal-binding protein YciE